MKKGKIKNSAELFLYKANIDFNTAKYLLKGFENGEVEIDFELIYFHLQQATEKLLKSLLSKYKIRILKTHDIEDLIELLEENRINLVDNIHSLEKLTYYAVEGRYAIIHDDLDDVESYIKIIDNLLKFTKKEIDENI